MYRNVNKANTSVVSTVHITELSILDMTSVILGAERVIWSNSFLNEFFTLKSEVRVLGQLQTRWKTKCMFYIAFLMWLNQIRMNWFANIIFSTWCSNISSTLLKPVMSHTRCSSRKIFEQMGSSNLHDIKHCECYFTLCTPCNSTPAQFTLHWWKSYWKSEWLETLEDTAVEDGCEVQQYIVSYRVMTMYCC
jgi:hypothetical protein